MKVILARTVEEIQQFKNEHGKCNIELFRSPNVEIKGFAFTCDEHQVMFVTVIMPEFCRKPSLDCAISGYCKREIACNH